MFIKLTNDLPYRGQEHKAGDIIEVGDALGSNLVLNGHKQSNAEAFANQGESSNEDVLTEEQINDLDYKDAQKLIAKHEIETEDKAETTYKEKLKAFFSIGGN